MEVYKEHTWYWYIFENRTLQETYNLLTAMWNEQRSQLIVQELEGTAPITIKSSNNGTLQ